MVERFSPDPHIYASQHSRPSQLGEATLHLRRQPRETAHAENKRARAYVYLTKAAAHRKTNRICLPSKANTRGENGLPLFTNRFDRTNPSTSYCCSTTREPYCNKRDRPCVLQYLMKAGQDMPSSEPFQLFPGLDQQAPVRHRNWHFPRMTICTFRLEMTRPRVKSWIKNRGTRGAEGIPQQRSTRRCRPKFVRDQQRIIKKRDASEENIS